MDKIILLAVDTSAKVCSANLSIDGVSLATYETKVEKSSSERLKLYSDRLLEDHQLSYSDLSGLAVSVGPGSYTGLRIGVSFIKGLSFALNLPVVAINTLQSIAYQLAKVQHQTGLNFCSMLDARRMEVFTATFNSKLEFVHQTKAVILEEEFLLSHPSPTVFLGDGAFKLKKFNLLEGQRIIDNIFPSAKEIGELAYPLFMKKQFVDTAYFEPYYLKDFISVNP